MLPNEVVIASQQLEVIFQKLLLPYVTDCPANKIRRTLLDCEIQPFTIGSDQFCGIFGVAPCLFPPSGCTHPESLLLIDNAIFPPSLGSPGRKDKLPKNPPDDALVIFESVRGNEREAFVIHSARNISKQAEPVSIAPPSYDGRWPKTRPDVDRNKDPDRLLLASHHRTNLIGL